MVVSRGHMLNLVFGEEYPWPLPDYRHQLNLQNPPHIENSLSARSYVFHPL